MLERALLYEPNSRLYKTLLKIPILIMQYFLSKQVEIFKQLTVHLERLISKLAIGRHMSHYFAN